MEKMPSNVYSFVDIIVLRLISEVLLVSHGYISFKAYGKLGDGCMRTHHTLVIYNFFYKSKIIPK